MGVNMEAIHSDICLLTVLLLVFLLYFLVVQPLD